MQFSCRLQCTSRLDSGSTLFCVAHRSLRHCLIAGSTCRAVTLLRRWHSVPRYLSSWRHPFPARASLTLRRRYQHLVQITSPAAERQQNWGYLVRIAGKSDQAKQSGLFSSSRIVYYTIVHCRPRSRSSSRQRAVNEAACHESSRYLLLPSTPSTPLHRIQNASARLIFALGPREQITLCILQPHWLPVCWRIQFKLCCIMHSVFNGNCPTYLSDIVQTANASRPRLRLAYMYHRHRPTTCCHDIAPSLASAPFLALVRLRGTECLKTFAQNLTSHTFESFSKLILLVLRSMFVNCNSY